ncbi:MAG: hypothetical protein Q9167_000511 [Letrouitia subvulpina]
MSVLISYSASGTLKAFLSFILVLCSVGHLLADAAPTSSHTLASLLSRRGDPTCAGPGLVVKNKSGGKQTFYFYKNDGADYGQATSSFTSVTLAAGVAQFVSLPLDFKGHVQRGDKLPCTWVEFQLNDESTKYHDKKAHGDVSIEQGYDGAAIIRAMDGSEIRNGFKKDISIGAPHEAFFKNLVHSDKLTNKPNVLDTIMGNWWGAANHWAKDWAHSQLEQKNVYMGGEEGTDDVASANHCMAVDFY